MKILVIIPAYNESENILRTVFNLQKHAPQTHLIVINDSSTDDTRKILFENWISFLDLPVNLGIGGGVQTGYQYALEHDYDIAIQFDGDGQHDARYIKELISPIISGQADIVIGSRFIKKEGFQSSALRRLGIYFLSGLIQLLCGIKVQDVTSGMRAVNRKMIKEFAENYAQDYPEPEAILASGLKGARIAEVPVIMHERQGGQSSIHSFKSAYYMLKVSIALILERLTIKKERG
ncbi:glycosyltransferase family 2 protein [Agathobaculum sp. NTUH-O15-33]|uniref:glycosyltransferase family 2 protein n=1 Tax=Agathobaculum sp. NTUH-O15-33 TaxID=3079302 RepID=UPI0029585E98|nr:glycosyltransferase family 2 protein [Agathobaculum sp. NTUH-O15-33]WNX84090.1 glycosyltransferase family 2 protein [Agathobaculum sp. NTUH-O15-33]